MVYTNKAICPEKVSYTFFVELLLNLWTFSIFKSDLQSVYYFVPIYPA